MFIFRTVFDGILEVSRHPCEPWGGSWEVLGAPGVSPEALRGSRGKRARDWSVKRGGLEIEFVIPGRVHEGITAILSMYFDDFQKDLFFIGR